MILTSVPATVTGASGHTMREHIQLSIEKCSLGHNHLKVVSSVGNGSIDIELNEKQLEYLFVQYAIDNGFFDFLKTGDVHNDLAS